MTEERPIRMLCEVADKLRPLESDPPCQHWLCSDATYSYCWPCARLARWFEMDRMGPLPPPSEWYNRSEVEEEINEGIDGGDWYSGESDTPQSCEMCHRLLRFSLTSYGCSYTLEGFEAESIGPETLANPDAVYELRQMLDQGAWDKDDELTAELVRTATRVNEILASRAALTEVTGGEG